MPAERVPRRALQLFEATLYQDTMPDVLTYSAIISACDKVPECALQFFDVMLHQASCLT